ncbi:MAG: substrate-binding domain-containing protein [Desulfobacteraceae bacterium]|jgi:tungstate transport system substrate-binding protein
MKKHAKWLLVSGLIAMSLALAMPAAAGQGKTLLMATTTSTDNTGLLDYLAPEFTKATGIELKWTAVGTGKALKLGQNCDVDVLMVHAPGAEKKYVKEGYGIQRREVMFNDFVIIGPPADPAGVKGQSVKSALQTVAAKSAVFVSRGDNSGTNKKEISLWKSTGAAVPEKESWYVQTGQGMLASINIAAQKNGYTMTDRGTFIKYAHNHGGKPPLVVLVEGDDILKNQYSVMLVNPARCKKVQSDLAQQFCDWICDAPAQKLIADFRLMGKQLFTPDAKK